MKTPNTISDFIHFVGGVVSFVDTCGGIMIYHCEQREGVRESWLPFDFQVRVRDNENATLLFAGGDGKTVNMTMGWFDDMCSDTPELTLVMPEDVNGRAGRLVHM